MHGHTLIFVFIFMPVLLIDYQDHNGSREIKPSTVGDVCKFSLITVEKLQLYVHSCRVWIMVVRNCTQFVQILGQNKVQLVNASTSVSIFSDSKWLFLADAAPVCQLARVLPHALQW